MIKDIGFFFLVILLFPIHMIGYVYGMALIAFDDGVHNGKRDMELK